MRLVFLAENWSAVPSRRTTRFRPLVGRTGTGGEGVVSITGIVLGGGGACGVGETICGASLVLDELVCTGGGTELTTGGFDVSDRVRVLGVDWGLDCLLPILKRRMPLANVRGRSQG